MKRKCGNNMTGKGVQERKEKKEKMKRTRHWKLKESVERRGEEIRGKGEERERRK